MLIQLERAINKDNLKSQTQKSNFYPSVKMTRNLFHIGTLVRTPFILLTAPSGPLLALCRQKDRTQMQLQRWMSADILETIIIICTTSGLTLNFSSTLISPRIVYWRGDSLGTICFDFCFLLFGFFETNYDFLISATTLMWPQRLHMRAV